MEQLLEPVQDKDLLWSHIVGSPEVLEAHFQQSKSLIIRNLVHNETIALGDYETSEPSETSEYE